MANSIDKREMLEHWTRRLSALAVAGDWQALATLDLELAEYLHRSARCAWSPTERAALQRLQEAHAHARECCDREAQSLAEQLAQMRAHKDAWIAYAMSNESDETTT